MIGRRHPEFVRFGLIFELALIPLAFAIGRAFGVDPWRDFDPDPRSIGLGLLAALPLVPILPLSELRPIGPLRRIRDLLDRHVVPMLRGASPIGLATLAAAAGIGEETFFRGLVQSGLDGAVGPWPSLAIASVVFGLLHAVTPGYAVLAAGIGLYLGLLFRWSGDLTVPVVAHGAYDLVALAYILRLARERPAGEDLP